MPLSDAERNTLLDLARRAVEAEVGGGPAPMASREGLLAERRGCFVTLTNRGRLRGCTGTFSPREVLARAVVAMAQAACNDPRFTRDPVRPDELGDLHIEVSILSELELTTEPQNLRVGVHGIYIVRDGQAGCFLPEVATDQGWDAAEFLSCCCAEKAGLPANAWQDPQTQVYLFTSEKISEHV